jgi:site-specific DNA recombinase
LIERAKDIASGEIVALYTFIRASIVRVQVHMDRIDVAMDQDGVRALIDGVTKKVGPNEQTESETNHQVTTLSIPARLKRTGKEMRIVLTDGSQPATPDSGLVRLLVRANAIRDLLLADRSLTFEDIAKIEGVVPSYATRLFRLTVLAPDIVTAILSGRQPPELSARRLMDDTRLPLVWNEQRRFLGFASTL